MVYTWVAGEATGADLPDGLADPIALARSILTMLLDMRDWIQLQGGVYLHASDARLVIVLGELLLSWDQAQEVLGVPKEYWHCQLVALLCRLYPSIDRAGVTERDTTVIERCDYVV